MFNVHIPFPFDRPKAMMFTIAPMLSFFFTASTLVFPTLTFSFKIIQSDQSMLPAVLDVFGFVNTIVPHQLYAFQTLSWDRLPD